MSDNATRIANLEEQVERLEELFNDLEEMWEKIMQDYLAKKEELKNTLAELAEM